MNDSLDLINGVLLLMALIYAALLLHGKVSVQNPNIQKAINAYKEKNIPFIVVYTGLIVLIIATIQKLLYV